MSPDTVKTKFYATVREAQFALANKIATEKLGRKWGIEQTDSGWYWITQIR